MTTTVKKHAIVYYSFWFIYILLHIARLPYVVGVYDCHGYHVVNGDNCVWAFDYFVTKDAWNHNNVTLILVFVKLPRFCIWLLWLTHVARVGSASCEISIRVAVVQTFVTQACITGLTLFHSLSCAGVSNLDTMLGSGIGKERHKKEYEHKTKSALKFEDWQHQFVSCCHPEEDIPSAAGNLHSLQLPYPLQQLRNALLVLERAPCGLLHLLSGFNWNRDVPTSLLCDEVSHVQCWSHRPLSLLTSTWRKVVPPMPASLSILRNPSTTLQSTTIEMFGPRHSHTSQHRSR